MREIGLQPRETGKRTPEDLRRTLGANFWKFCPYCGTKMDGGADNG